MLYYPYKLSILQ